MGQHWTVTVRYWSKRRIFGTTGSSEIVATCPRGTGGVSCEEKTYKLRKSESWARSSIRMRPVIGSCLSPSLKMPAVIP